MTWDLPSAVEINGINYAVSADYRDILDIIGQLDSQDESPETNIYYAMAMFYENFFEIPEEHYQEAAELMMWFINCGQDVEQNEHNAPKQLDWEQDGLIIAADINKVAGCDVRAFPFLHWWTFISYFMGIGEGQLSTIVSIREKLRKGKQLDEWEKEYYRNNKSKVDFKAKYTEKEIAEREKINKLLG